MEIACSAIRWGKSLHMLLFCLLNAIEFRLPFGVVSWNPPRSCIKSANPDISSRFDVEISERRCARSQIQLCCLE
jgi:hypothetical protein